MTKLVCVEPVFKAGTLSSFTVFDSQGAFLLHHISDVHSTNASRYFVPLDYTHVCYDAFKTLGVFGDKFPILWDVKILYELLGHKAKTFTSLSQTVLGFEKTKRYKEISDQLTAQMRSYKEAKINLTQYSAVEFLPEDLLRDLYLERAKITTELFTRLTDEDKKFYLSFYESVKNLYGAASDPLNIDLSAIEDDHSHHAYNIRRNVKDGKSHLKFQAVGAKTGRLSFDKGSLNVYILPRDIRSCIVASKGHKLVEVDFKSFQPRIAIFSTENEEFKDVFRQLDDIYAILPGDRAKNKIAFLAWMFAKARMPNEVFDKYLWEIWELRNSLVKKVRHQGFLETRWGRRLHLKDEPKHVVFQNFITATEVDCVLNLMNKFVEMGIKVKFPFHDAIVCEVEDDFDLNILKTTSEKFLFDTFQARFPVQIKCGSDFGNMNEF